MSLQAAMPAAARHASKGLVTLSHCRRTLAAVDESMRPLSYAGYRFPPEIIQHAIWLYLRFTLSFRDVEELLAERGIDVSYETIRRWVAVFGRAAGLHQSFGYGGRIQMAGSGDRD